MGTRIAFRPRARGCAVAGTVPYTGEVTASALEPRVKFVKGTTATPSSGEVKVGDGTFFPMQATIQQIFELFYRVKDARFDAQSCISRDDRPSGGYPEIAFSSTAPSPNYHDAQFGSGWYVKTERSWVSAGVNLTDELQIWTNTLDEPEEALVAAGDAFDTIMPTNPDHGIVCGLSHYSEFDCGLTPYDTFYSGFPSAYFPYATDVTDSQYIINAGVELAFNGVVAVTGDGDPFNNANDLYIGLHFEAYTQDGSPYLYNLDAFTYDSTFSSYSTGVNLEIVLATGSITAPLYSSTTGSLGWGGYGFVLRATEWWPYAHHNGKPVWNTGTGAWRSPFAP